VYLIKSTYNYLFLILLFISVFVIHENGSAQKPKYKFGDYIQFGRMELEKGNYTKAIQYLNNAVKHRPASYEGYFLRGIGKYYLDDYIGAEFDFTESMKYDPYNAEIYHFRAIVRSAQYNLGGAMVDYARAIELNPKNPLFYLNRSRAHLFLQEFDSAIADCNRSIKLDYKKEEVYLIRGMAYREIEFFDESLEDFNRAIRRNPDNTYNYVQRGLLNMDRDEPDQAIDDFDRAIVMNSNDSFALFHRGLARIETSDTLGAYDDLNRVIELSPRNSYAYYNRAILRLGEHDEEGALEDLDRVISLNPDNIIVYLYRGKIKYGMDKLEEAMADFNKAIEIYPEFADAYYERSQVKKQMQDFAGAEEDYQMAYTMNAFNFQRSDSLKLQEEMYIRRLMAFSGEFTDNTEAKNKLQDQRVDIELQSIFTTILFASKMEGIRFYDTFSKTSYNTTLLSLTNDYDIINERLAQYELNKLNDTLKLIKPSWEDYLKRAKMKAEIQDYSSALKDYNNAILLNPDNVQAWFGRANTRLKLIELLNTEFDEEYLFQASTDFDQGSDPYTQTSQQHTYEEVLEDYNKVLTIDPDFYFAWYNRGNIKAIKGDYWGAVRDYTQAIQLDPTFSSAYYNKGLILISLNLKTLGCQDISQAGELGIDEAYPVLKRFCTK